MGAVQLNIRIDSQLKSDVDAALGAMWRSSTDTIRILWRYIQANAGELQQVVHVLQRRERATQESKLPEGARAPWQQVDELYLQGLARAGVDPRAVLPQEDDGELYLQAMLERLEERGVRD